LEINLVRSNFSEKILSYSISDYEGVKSAETIKNIIKYTDEFKTKFYDKSLFFYGGMSTQKTTIAKWVGMRVIEQGKTAYYILMNDLLKELTSLPRDETEAAELKARVDRYMNADLLVIDEAFTKDRNTIYKSRYQIPYIDTFLRSRLETTSKATILVSNETIESIDEDIFNPYIKELVKRNCHLMEFKDKIGSTQNVEDIFN
jgi:DNA replication protein DnaC